MGLRYVVVGGGAMGELHARVLHDVADVELVAVVEPDAAQRTRLAESVPYPVVARLEDVEGPIDAASICTPDDVRMPVVEPLLAAGTALLIEKPLATTVSEANRVIDACRRDNQVMVGQIMRFDPRVLQVRRAVSRDEFTELWAGRIWRCSNTGTGTRISPRTSVEWYLGVHDVDLIRFVTGQEITAVRAIGRSVISDRHDLVRGQLTLSSSATIGFDWSWIWPRHFPAVMTAGIELVASRGAVTADLGHNSVALTTGDPARQQNVDVFHWPIEPDGRQGGDVRAEVTDFVDAVKGDLPMPVSAAEGLENVRVIEAVENSCHEDGAPVALA